MELIDILMIVALVILVVLSGFFSGAEIAFATCNKIRLQQNFEKNKRGAKRAYKISQNFTSTLSSILVGNNLVNIAASSIATVFFAKFFGTKGPSYAAIVMTASIIVFGEVIPKLYAAQKANKLVYVLAYPLQLCIWIFTPISWLFNKLVNLIAPIWTPKEVDPSVTDDELVSIVDSIEDEGVIDEQKSDLIKSAIKFGDVDAYEIMVPRVDMVSFDVDDPIETFLETPELLQHAYIPVYQDSIDNILGVVSTKKITRLFINKEKIDIKSLLEEPLYVHRTKAIQDIIKELRDNRMHMAIVMDEFGGIDGLLTAEDILEELVGDIWDEIDDVEYEYIEKEDGVFIIDGDMNIYDMFELLEINDKDFESEYSTVGGWITEVLERFPEPNDEFEYRNLLVKVLSVDDVRVEKAEIRIKESQGE